MDFAMNVDQIESLSKLLDPANQAKGGVSFERPASQKVGYSLHEAQPDRAQISSIDGKPPPATGAPSNPGLVSLPPALAAKQDAQRAGLPVPSQTREGREIAAARAAAAAGGGGGEFGATRVTRAKGNTIWNDDEVDASFGAGAGEIAAERAPASSSSFSSSPPVAVAANSATTISAATTAAASSAAAQVHIPKSRRPVPEYAIVFKHNVSAEDRFLGMDFTKDGSANTADALVVRIEMPLEQSAKDVSLDVKEEELSLASPQYQLRVGLPFKVLTGSAAATWDKSKKLLSVSLRADPTKREVMLM